MRITDHCYVIYGLTTIPPWMVNAGFIVGSQTTLVVDCGYNYLSAQTIYGYALAARPKNRLIALNTEPHSDHMGGNCFFQEKGIDVYGHARIQRSEGELTEVKKAYHASITNPVRKGMHEEDVVFHKTRFVNPNMTLAEDTSIDLGDIEAQVLLTPGHTPMNLSVFVPSDGVLYSSDTIISGYIPHLAEGTPEDWKNWLTSLKRIEDLIVNWIVPGHGEAIPEDCVNREIKRITAIVEKAVAEGVSPVP